MKKDLKSKNRSIADIGNDLEKIEESKDALEKTVSLALKMEKDEDYTFHLVFGCTDDVLIDSELETLEDKVQEISNSDISSKIPSQLKNVFEQMLKKDIIDKHTISFGGDLPVSDYLTLMECYANILNKRKKALGRELKDVVSERV